FYTSVSFIPVALPLAILLSSLMTMGGMGEHYELIAFKSAGISLRKIMMPLIIVSVILAVVAFFFSNNVLPHTTLKQLSLLYDLRQKKPALNIDEGIFYDGLDNFVIRIGKRDRDGQTIRDVTIYDHSDRRGNVNLTVAQKGTMIVTPDNSTLVISLFDGTKYEEMVERDQANPTREFQRMSFDEKVVRFDLSSFQLFRTEEHLFRNDQRMLNIVQLRVFRDSLSNELQRMRNDYRDDYFKRISNFNKVNTNRLDSLTKEGAKSIVFLQSNKIDNLERTLDFGASIARSNKDNSHYSNNEFRERRRRLAFYEIEFHRKFTLSFACILLFLIGAPLGAIIRKGGFGMPVVISVLFFVIFHVSSYSGEKFAREGALSAEIGMWIAPLLFLPIGILLTRMAISDSSVFNIERYTAFFDKIYKLILKGKTQ
ncbi:MAG: YjgP/YjgQ family permease, partial [Candidatus Moranbacteria bacterium]|nr:YjgP/YjgQ family permease [Candidatus Moranbacteria bacterium]